MATGVRQKYNIALNSKGYILKSAPSFPLYDKRNIPSQVDRLAISDVQYSDFSGAGLFYIAQTDWSAGFKDEKSWKDDAQFFYSTNVDVYSERGAMKLEVATEQVGSDLDAGAEIICGALAEVNSVVNFYIGTDDATGDSKPRIYKLSGGVLSSVITFAGTGPSSVSQLLGHKNYLWAFDTLGSGSTEMVQKFDGTSWTDHSAAVATASTFSPTASRCAAELGGILYIGVDSAVGNDVGIVSTVDNGANFLLEMYMETNSLIISMAAYAGKIYYLLAQTGLMELRVFDPATNVDTTVQTFYNTNNESAGVGNKYLRVFRGKLIITIPDNSVYSYDESELILIFDRSSFRRTINSEAQVYLRQGAIEVNNKLYWYNLIYDGEAWFNHKKNFTDTVTSNRRLHPIGYDASNVIYYLDTQNPSKLYGDSSAGVYKSTTDVNYLVMSEMDAISSIDKLLDNITIIFDALTTGTSIGVDYSIDDRTTWVPIGSVTAAGDANATKRTFFPPSTVKYNKIWLRIRLNTSTTTNTPVLRDVILAYKPFPDYKVRWTMTLDASNQVGLLNGQNDQRSGVEITNELWNLMNLKQKVVLEDIDYFECRLDVALTAGATSANIRTSLPIPRAGRLRATTSGYVEEMYYTSASNDKIWGMTRGARGTKARAYATNVILKNDYDVYVDSADTRIDVTDENKTENRVQVVLVEA